ncbi:MAG: hypothetical protein ABFS45_06140 [Pseudomonadota bacterium]
MTGYRRTKVKRASYFFTVNCAERHGNRLLVEHIDLLQQTFLKVKKDHPFKINAANFGVRSCNQELQTLVSGLAIKHL